MRSGTLPPALCVGLGEAARLAAAEMAEDTARITGLRDRFLNALRTRLPDVKINGDMECRLPGNLNLAFAGVEAEALMRALPSLAVSTGSACTSASVEPSYVLSALGMAKERSLASLRIGIGRFTTEPEIDTAVSQIVSAVTELRA